jgi:hypothetical protein
MAGWFGGKGSAFLAAGGDAAGVLSVPFTVDPLEQDVQQKVAAKDAKAEEHVERHGDLTRADANG